MASGRIRGLLLISDLSLDKVVQGIHKYTEGSDMFRSPAIRKVHTGAAVPCVSTELGLLSLNRSPTALEAVNSQVNQIWAGVANFL